MLSNVGVVELLMVLFLVVLAIPWFLLPFAVFGTKSKLDELISEARQTNAELEKLRQKMADSGHAQS